MLLSVILGIFAVKVLLPHTEACICGAHAVLPAAQYNVPELKTCSGVICLMTYLLLNNIRALHSPIGARSVYGSQKALLLDEDLPQGRQPSISLLQCFRLV